LSNGISKGTTEKTEELMTWLKNKYVQIIIGAVVSAATYLILTQIGVDQATVLKVTIAVAGAFGITITGVAIASRK
jgi:ABC-type transporter Mla maintaining outer membrane lipid asymmetry permease subunit MlaE